MVSEGEENPAAVLPSSREQNASAEAVTDAPREGVLHYARPMAYPRAWWQRELSASEAMFAFGAMGTTIIFGSSVLVGAVGVEAVPLWGVGVVLWVVAGAAALSHAWTRPRPEAGQAWRTATRTMLVVTLLGSLGYGSCPHAAWLSFGPVPVPVAGRMCGNPHRVMPLWLLMLR